MTHIYDNSVKEQKIMKHAQDNNCSVYMQLVTENAIMFTVREKDLETMKKFCKEQFGSWEIVEEIDDVLMCKVKT